MRVCIIGAGVAGLISAHVIKQLSETYQRITTQIVIYEQNSSLGGTWVLNNPGSSMYEDLVTNLPKHVMQFSNVAFPESVPEYPSHEQVLNYIREFAALHRLDELIVFQRQVVLVSPKESGFLVETKDLVSQAEFLEEFDSVLVCNGHFSVPSFPSIEGLEALEARGVRVLHSHDFRNPNSFVGKSVLVVGAGFSGLDIGSHLHEVTSSLCISYREKGLSSEETQALHTRIKRSGRDLTWLDSCRVPQVQSFDLDGSAVFSDGTRGKFDVVLFCTGYFYHLPFLHSSLLPKKTSRTLPCLYLDLFHCDYPSGKLAFIGIPWSVSPFPLSEVQACVVSHVLFGGLRLPETEDMKRMCRERYAEFIRSGLPERYLHKANHVLYCKNLIEMIRDCHSNKFDWEYSVWEDRAVRRVPLH